MLALREQIKELQILNTRQQEDLQKAQTGISKAISKTEKPSMEIQGEIAEEILLDDLQDAFPKDEFKPIKKGRKRGRYLANHNTSKRTCCRQYFV